MNRFAVAGTFAVILLSTLIVPGHDNVAHAAGPSFTISWDVSSSTVNVGDSFTLEVRLHDVSGSGDHGGISVSFPWLTDSGASSYSYSSSRADVEVLSYTTARSRVSLYDRGDTIYDSDNRQVRAEYLLVEADDPSWSSSSDRLLRLRISPKQANESFSIQLRGWICADEYQDCSRAPSSGGRRDQQGWPVASRTVTVVSQDSDDFGDSRSDAMRIAVGVNIEGDIETSGDIDYFSFIADPGVTYTIETTLLSIDDTVLWLYGSSGSSIEENDDWDSGYASRIQWTPSSSGTYYAAVGGYESSTGTYRLSISAEAAPTQPSDDHGNSRSDATAISTDTSVGGDIETNGDVDYFSFNADPGVTYTIETTLLSIDDTVLWLYGSSGSSIEFDDDGGEGRAERIEWTAPSSGVYYAVVGGYDVRTGTYGLSISAEAAPPQASDDHGNSLLGATSISVGATVDGNIETSGDVDYFSFSALLGSIYTIETSAGSLEDTVLTLYDSRGSTIDSDDNGGEEYASKIQWRPQSFGTYYATVSGNGNNTGTYRLSVSSSPSVDTPTIVLPPLTTDVGYIDISNLACTEHHAYFIMTLTTPPPNMYYLAANISGPSGTEIAMYPLIHEQEDEDWKLILAEAVLKDAAGTVIPIPIGTLEATMKLLVNEHFLDDSNLPLTELEIITYNNPPNLRTQYIVHVTSSGNRSSWEINATEKWAREANETISSNPIYPAPICRP